MGYYQGESVIDYTYCEDDVFNSAKSNIRHFIHIIIGLVLGLGILTIILSTLIGTISCLGGCLGCEACLETAACADEMIEGCDGCDECNYEEKTQANIERANDCASCDGFDCFGRTGCFSCGGCGDCVDCDGKKYYYFKVSYNGNVVSMKLEENDLYSYHSSSDYMQFLGLYDKPSGGKQYIDGYGSIVQAPKEGMMLYPRFQEYNLGEIYTFTLKLSEFDMMDESIQLTVGGPLVGLPTAPEKVGYNFVGWYCNDRLVVNGNLQGGEEFHLSNFGISPSNTSRNYTLTPKYAPVDCKITFVINGESYTVTASYNDTFGVACEKLENTYGLNVENWESFFGWGTTADASPEEGIYSEKQIKSAMTVYAIIREAVFINFHYNTPSNNQTISIKLREGQTNVRFSDYGELTVIEDSNVYPGYEWTGWYTTSYDGVDDQRSESIALVTKNMNKDYYAHWKKAVYRIEYKVMNHMSGVENTLYADTYEMSSTAQEIKGTEDIDPQVGYDFIGWYLENASGTQLITELPAYTYGNLELHAAFAPHKYKFSLRSAPGSYVSGTSNMGEAKDLSYGEAYKLVIPTRVGYEFLGWYCGEIACTDGNGQSLNPLTLQSLGMTPTLETEGTLYDASEKTYVVSMTAKWKIQTFEVQLRTENGLYETIEVEWNKKIDLTTVTAPSKEGYNFLGWKYESGTLFNSDTTVTSDLTLYAAFEIKKFTVTFMIETSKGGTPNAYPVNNVEWGKTLTEAKGKLSNYPNDEALHRRLVGWYTTAELQSKLPDTYVITDAVTVYAKYDYAYQFTFDSANVQYYYQGEAVDFPDATSKPGYEFKGWCSDRDCLTTPIKEDVLICDGETMPRQYYAKYEAIVYTITYQNEDGTTWFTDYYTIEDTTGQSFTLLRDYEAPNKTGYTFVGWKEKNINGMLTGGTITELKNKKHGDLTLVAQYSPLTYKVTLRNEGNNEVKDVKFDDAFDFGVPTDKTGYHFIGWSWTNDPNDLVTDNTGKSLVGKNYTYAYDTEIYPVYAVNVYTVSWRNAQDGTLFVETTAEHFSYIYNGQEVSVEGYTFENWYKDQNCQELFGFGTFKITGNIDIYAKFTPNQYAVHFVIGTDIKYEVTLTYGTLLADAMAAAAIKVNEDTASNHAKFVHWEDEEDTRVYDEEDTVPAKELTLIPKFYWPVTIEFYEGNTCVYTTDRYYYNEEVPAYTYEKTGYEFMGWYSDGELNDSKRVEFPITISDVASTTTLYFFAKWQPKAYTINYYMDSAHYSTETFTMEQTKVNGGYILSVPDGTVKPGYEFDGWYLSSNCTGEKLTTLDNSESVQNAELYNGSTIKLYGKWVQAKYTITLMKNKDTVWKTIEVHYGDSLTALPTLENMTDQLFSGWKLADTQMVVADSNGVWLAKYTTYTWTKDIVLVADWIKE